MLGHSRFCGLDQMKDILKAGEQSNTGMILLQVRNLKRLIETNMFKVGNIVRYIFEDTNNLAIIYKYDKVKRRYYIKWFSKNPLYSWDEEEFGQDTEWDFHSLQECFELVKVKCSK
jgi:hypothetical protein